MTPAEFEGLTLLNRRGICSRGWTEVCRNEAGTEKIRLCIRDRALQQRLLPELPREIPARMMDNTLELLLPLPQGQTLEEWIYFQKPRLGQRREVCLQVLGEAVARTLPETLVSMIADPDNLRVTPEKAGLACFPHLNCWTPEKGSGEAVQEMSRLMVRILTEGVQERDQYRFPAPLRLMILRAAEGEYTHWDTLQADLSALPDTLEPGGWHNFPAVLRLQELVEGYGGLAARCLVGLLAAAALLSLAQNIETRQNKRAESWPGMARVGDQILEEGDVE